MSILIEKMEMPKRVNENGQLLWKMQNDTLGLEVPFAAADIPCTLVFKRDGTCKLIVSVLEESFSLSNVPTPHGELIDRDVLLRDHVHKDDMMAYCDDFVYETAIEDMPTIIKAEE